MCSTHAWLFTPPNRFASIDLDPVPRDWLLSPFVPSLLTRVALLCLRELVRGAS